MRYVFASLLVFGISAAVFALSLNIDPNQSGSIAVGTSATSPTQIFTNDPAATKTCVVNTSTNTVFFVGYSTTSALSIGTNTSVSTSVSTGSFFLQGTLVNSATVQAQQFCFDGNNDNFRGPVWAVAGGSGATIQRIRMH